MRRMTQKQRLQVEAEREALLLLEAAYGRAYEVIGRLPASVRERDLDLVNADVGRAFEILSATIAEVKPVVRKAKKRRAVIDTQHS